MIISKMYHAKHIYKSKTTIHHFTYKRTSDILAVYNEQDACSSNLSDHKFCRLNLTWYLHMFNPGLILLTKGKLYHRLTDTLHFWDDPKSVIRNHEEFSYPFINVIMLLHRRFWIEKSAIHFCWIKKSHLKLLFFG